MSEDAFFAVPAGGEPMPMEGGETPIILGGPPPPSNDAVFLGNVDESPAIIPPPVGVEDGGAILLGAPPPTESDVVVPEDDDAGAELIDTVAESTEPSPMQKWNAEWQETLLKRKDEENALKAEMVEQARLDMENFNAERDQKRENKMAANRSDEQAKLEAIEADLENDNSWQRVCKMIELSHDNKADAEDVKRMRDVMILLKNEPARATALTS